MQQVIVTGIGQSYGHAGQSTDGMTSGWYSVDFTSSESGPDTLSVLGVHCKSLDERDTCIRRFLQAYHGAADPLIHLAPPHHLAHRPLEGYPYRDFHRLNVVYDFLFYGELSPPCCQLSYL
ncbi:hypothetical protein TNCV_4021721 [Trichonephila clavipes]|nr:hypothetical protein TNCV_4021721 [Trichonephila clavipes]